MKILKQKIVEIIIDAIATSIQGGIPKDIAKTRANQILEVIEKEHKESFIKDLVSKGYSETIKNFKIKTPSEQEVLDEIREIDLKRIKLAKIEDKVIVWREKLK